MPKIKETLSVSWESNNIVEIHHGVSQMMQGILSNFPSGNIIPATDMMGNTFFFYEKPGCKKQTLICKVAITHNMESKRFDTTMDYYEFKQS